jgi:putative peptidoglycan lipid II flippase
MKFNFVLFTVLIILGKASGFVKELFISYYHGASPLTDTYVIANTLTSTLYIGIYASIPFVVVPLYSRCFDSNSQTRSDVTSALLSYLLISFMLSVASWLAFSFFGLANVIPQSTPNSELLTLFVLISALTFLPSTISAFFNALYSAHGATQWVYIVATTNNLAFCVSIFFFREPSNFYLVLVAGLLGWVILAAVAGVTFTLRHWRKFFYDLTNQFPTFKPIAAAIPTIAFSYLDQFLITAAILAAGAQIINGASIFNYSVKLLVLFVTVISLFMTTFAFTRMSKFAASGDTNSLEIFSHLIFDLTIRIFLPLAVVLSCLSSFLVKLVFERGAFSPENSTAVSMSMSVVVLSLPFLALKELLVRYMFATFRQRHCINSVLFAIVIFFICMGICTYTNTPNAASIAYLIATVTSTLYLVAYFYEASPTRRSKTLTGSLTPAIALSFVIFLLYLLLDHLFHLDTYFIAVVLSLCYLFSIAPYLYSRRVDLSRFY